APPPTLTSPAPALPNAEVGGSSPPRPTTPPKSRRHSGSDGRMSPRIHPIEPRWSWSARSGLWRRYELVTCGCGPSWSPISPQDPTKARRPEAVSDRSSCGDRLRQVLGARPRRDAGRDERGAGQQTKAVDHRAERRFAEAGDGG